MCFTCLKLYIPLSLSFSLLLFLFVFVNIIKSCVCFHCLHIILPFLFHPHKQVTQVVENKEDKEEEPSSPSNSSSTSNDKTTKTLVSHFNLVDLAGSERQQDTHTEGNQLKEASGINKSLSNLGLVIQALVDRAHGKRRHIHYRDSKVRVIECVCMCRESVYLVFFV